MTVRTLVRRERGRVRAALAAAWTLAVASGLLLVLAAATMLLGNSRWLLLPRPFPLLVWALLLAGAAAGLLLATRAMRRTVSLDRVAGAIESERGLRDGSLRGLLELEGSSVFARRAASDLERALHVRGSLAPLLRGRVRRRLLAATPVLAVAGIALSFSLASASDGLTAILSPLRAWRGELLPPVQIGELPLAVLRGERVQIDLTAPGRNAVVLDVRPTGQGWRRMVLPVERSDWSASVVLGPVDADLTIVAGDGRWTGDTIVLRVTDRPFMGDVRIRAVYPEYMARSTEQITPGERTRVPDGTLLEIDGRASVELSDVALVSERDSVPLRVRGHSFESRWHPPRTGVWQWRASGAGDAGRVVDVPAPLDLEMVPDSAPAIEIEWPVESEVVAAGDRVVLRLVASDDYGLSLIAVRSWRQSSAASGRAVMQRVATDQPSAWSGDAVLDLSPRELMPGEELRLVAVAVDNSPARRQSVSREIRIRIPTLEERRSLARELADSIAAGVSAAAGAQRDLARRTGEAAAARGERGGQSAQGDQRESRSSAPSSASNRMSFEAAEQARSLMREQMQLAQQIEEAREAAQALEQQLRNAGALDTALARTLREAQALLRDALTPELAEKLAALEQALQRLSADEVRRELGDLAAQQRRLREQLERGAEILKRAALEGAMQTLRDEARDLAQRERALADSMQRGRRGGNDARELERRSANLARDVTQLGERLERESAEAGARHTRDAAAQSARSAEELGRAQQSEQAGRASEAASAAREAGNAMQRAADALSRARQEQIEAWKSELTEELDVGIQELLQLSRSQQELEERVRGGTPSASLRSEQSAVQQGVDQVARRLESAGQKSSLLSPRSRSAMSEAQKQVSQATQSTAGGRPGQSAAQMQAASEALNRAAAALVRDRERAGRATSASGFAEMLEQLQQLAQQQGAMNAQASGLLQLPVGSAEAQAAARALAERQRALARALDQLGQLDESGNSSEMAREARDIAAQLESGRIDATTLARQQQLFRRLLSAGQTLEQEEREDTGRRESRAATGDDRFDPGTGDATGSAARRYREPDWNELRGLTPEERRAVLEYFRRINAGAR